MQASEQLPYDLVEFDPLRGIVVLDFGAGGLLRMVQKRELLSFYHGSELVARIVNDTGTTFGSANPDARYGGTLYIRNQLAAKLDFREGAWVIIPYNNFRALPEVTEQIPPLEYLARELGLFLPEDERVAAYDN